MYVKSVRLTIGNLRSEKMEQMKLSEVARLMYDLQEYCKNREGCCLNCIMFNNLCRAYHFVNDWGITLADIERLEREGK